jgi:hypothetical protein
MVNSRTLERYGPDTDVFVIYLEGRPMCAHALLLDKETRHARLLYSASRRLEDRESAYQCSALNRLLHWHEIQTYQSEGFGCYDFGGITSDPNDGIARFKTSFGGAVVREQSFLCAGSAWIGGIADRIRRRMRGLGGNGDTDTVRPSMLDESEVGSG